MAKVLLVEDDNNLREIYQARLMAEGYDIVAAQNGEEALVVAKQNKPDLIISDVMMPRISGFEMLDILRNTDELKSTKVIMLTALGQAEDQKRASGLGADKYLVKSQVTLEDIVNAAKELLGEDEGEIADVPPAPAIPDPVAAAEPATPVAAPAPVAAAVATTGAIPVATPPEPAAAPVAPVPAPAPTTLPEPPAPPAPIATPVPEPVVAAPAVPATPPMPPAPAAAIPAPAVAPTVATAAVPVVEPPAQAPAPAPIISMPSAEPTSQTATAAAAVSDAATQTLEAEEAALQSQIDSYASAPAETPLAVSPEEAKAEASNSQTITAAVEQLNSPAPDAPLQPPSVANAPAPAPAPIATPVPEPVAAAPAVPATPPMPPAAPVAPAPAPAPASNDSSNPVAGRKIIQPISDPAAKPNLDALLAKEEAAAPAPPAAPVVNGAQASAPPTPPPAAPGQSFDPNKAL